MICGYLSVTYAFLLKVWKSVRASYESIETTSKNLRCHSDGAKRRGIWFVAPRKIPRRASRSVGMTTIRLCHHPRFTRENLMRGLRRNHTISSAPCKISWAASLSITAFRRFREMRAFSFRKSSTALVDSLSSKNVIRGSKPRTFFA